MKLVEPTPFSSVRYGKYELLARLAVGGMAEIFLARATAIERFEKLVVLKRMLPQYATDGEFVRMFLEEARLAATLHHPNVVQVFDLGQEEGSYFFTMEYIHGQDLRKIISTCRSLGRTIPLEHALGIVIDIAAGLHYAHERTAPDGHPLGIVHRDVSPSNVLVTYEGCAKMADFGIAKATLREAPSRSGNIKGKICYMSPEQCQGLILDRRSDIFAIGILLYELVTGQDLYGNLSEPEVLKRISSGETLASFAQAPDCSSEMQAIIRKTLAHDPCGRYSSAQELRLALEEFARERKLAVSSVALAHFLEELFGRQVEAWREAERQGQSLEEHLTQTLDVGSRVRNLGDPDLRTVPNLPIVPAEPAPRSRSFAWWALGAGILLGTSVGLWALLAPARSGPPVPPIPPPRAATPPSPTREPHASSDLPSVPAHGTLGQDASPESQAAPVVGAASPAKVRSRVRSRSHATKPREKKKRIDLLTGEEFLH